MGCGASKEAGAVVTPSQRQGQGQGQNTLPESASGGIKSATNTTSSTMTTNNTEPTTTSSTRAPAASPMVMNLNDVVAEGPTDGRGRFLSYASGASTPNTSSGNLSETWDSTSNGSDKEKSQKRRNPKVLGHSGSAIGLDEIQIEGAGLTSKVVHIEVPFGKPIEEVYDGVNDGKVLGSGVSGLVRLVKHKKTGVEYAVKCLDLGLVGTKEGLAQLREEIFIMCQLDHPNIVRLEEVYESHSEIYLVQELCLGGELFDRLDEQPDYHYTEAECARLVKQMLSAVRYLHSKGIIHRDLKLENFLFSSTAKDSELKMIDFGLSKHFQFGEVHHEAVGTPYTVAPEVILGSYDERCDIWAIGVITFLLLSGDPPFGGCGGPEPLLTVRSNILSGKFSFEPEDIWCLVSEKGKEFVSALLVADPQARPLARQAQKHAWLREWASRQSRATDKGLNPNVVKALVNFKEYSDMRKLLSEVLSFTLLPDQIKDLRKEFEKMDTDGSGEISLAAFKQVLMTNAGAGSLGALTEDEIEGIFDAMRVSKSEARIHWHEFIAAGLSQCQVDDRNLRLAFDRLDSDHKGYITLDDIMNLVGGGEFHGEAQIRTMWTESMKSVNCTQAHITYDNFLLLMKGQTKEAEPFACPLQKPTLQQPPSTRASTSNLVVVPEGLQIDEDEAAISIDESKTAMPQISPIVTKPINDEAGPTILETTTEDDVSLHSLPNMGAGAVGMYESSSSDLGAASPSTSLESPGGKKIITDFIPNEATVVPDVNSAKPSIITRRRSKSLANEYEASNTDNESAIDTKKASFPGDARRAVRFPDQDIQANSELAKNKSALTVNRQLYRAHRQMRLSVMEASRQFEEQQARRARDVLTAQQEKEAGILGLGKAGLVMRHGHKVQVTSEAIRKYLEDYKKEQQQLLEKANKRGGRGRRSRKKTISDMSAMMNPSLGQDEMGDVAVKACQTPDATKTMFNPSPSTLIKAPPVPSIVPEKPELSKHASCSAVTSLGGLEPTIVEKSSIRKATVPGQFQKTQDPFSSDGMYGGARITQIDVQQISGATLTPPRPAGNS